MVLMESFRVPMGSSAHDFSLMGIDGVVHSLKDFSSAKILVVIFMCNHCPYVQACISRLVEIQRDYRDRGVELIGINSNDDQKYPEDGFEAMKIFAREHEMNFPYLRDDTQEVARAYKAQCTPDVYVYGSGSGSDGFGRRLVYHGRIDDNWKDAARVTRYDLRDALDAILDGREIQKEQFPSMGCSIKWRG